MNIPLLPPYPKEHIYPKATEVIRHKFHDKTLFLNTLDSAISIYCKNINNEPLKHYLEDLQKIVLLHNTSIVFLYSESEIERMFLNALNYVSFAEVVPPIIFTKPNHKYFAVDDSLASLYDKKFNELKVILNEPRLNKENFHEILGVSKVLINESSRKLIIEILTSNFELDIKSHFHVTIQGNITDIETPHNIRPDLFIWLPYQDKFKQEEFKLIVECDGYKYHKNKMSFVGDRLRDRKLLEHGYEHMRFSGAEIYDDPLNKAKELIDYLTKFVNESWMMKVHGLKNP